MKHLAVAAAIVLSLTSHARADVVDSSSNGFTIRNTYTIQATPADVYRKFVQNVGDWWNSEHTFSGSARNLHIEDKALGCFCEKLPNEGSVRHLEVVFAAPGKKLVMIGGLGPMQALATAGSMTILLSPTEGGTKLEMTYTVSGYVSGGMNTWSTPADGMLKEQFTRFKNYVEHGDPAKK